MIFLGVCFIVLLVIGDLEKEVKIGSLKFLGAVFLALVVFDICLAARPKALGRGSGSGYGSGSVGGNRGGGEGLGSGSGYGEGYGS
ncbi:unnamed protein product [Eruca vesicaria subsp. sativa]|uniref:Glycine-rich protein n=1 Tax=Eruca vesicaria subsp. sativa TaxID=29727 RepID=A0ABC8L6H1_ERUVS|nr:unnamed protein product [Eruca vesicaria subsp. sativa]